MTSWDRQLWRLAAKLQAGYANKTSREFNLRWPAADWRELRNSLKRLRVAEEHRWMHAVRQVRDELELDFVQLEARLRDAKSTVRAIGRQTSPTVRLLYDELLAAKTEFEGFDYDGKGGVVSIVTDEIVLEGIGLGSFQIELDVEHLQGTSLDYSVKALEPNPASASDDTTHPHVHASHLCAGEGYPMIANALAEGRLFDFFTIVNQILHTYAPDAAYVRLSQWDGEDCNDCGYAIVSGGSGRCYHCENLICDECCRCCAGCCEGYCGNCINCCRVCEENYCNECLERCRRCNRSCCPNCLTDQVCASCLEKEKEEQENEDHEQNEQPTGAAVHSVCLG